MITCLRVSYCIEYIILTKVTVCRFQENTNLQSIMPSRHQGAPCRSDRLPSPGRHRVGPIASRHQGAPCQSDRLPSPERPMPVRSPPVSRAPHAGPIASRQCPYITAMRLYAVLGVNISALLAPSPLSVGRSEPVYRHADWPFRPTMACEI